MECVDFLLVTFHSNFWSELGYFLPLAPFGRLEFRKQSNLPNLLNVQTQFFLLLAGYSRRLETYLQTRLPGAVSQPFFKI